jgi:hypothetical protein
MSDTQDISRKKGEDMQRIRAVFSGAEPYFPFPLKIFQCGPRTQA